MFYRVCIFFSPRKNVPPGAPILGQTGALPKRFRTGPESDWCANIEPFRRALRPMDIPICGAPSRPKHAKLQEEVHMTRTSKPISPIALDLCIGGFGAFPQTNTAPVVSPARGPATAHRNSGASAYANEFVAPAGEEDPVQALALSLAALRFQHTPGHRVGAGGLRPFR